MGIDFWENHVRIGLTDFSKIKLDESNKYWHIKKGFIKPKPIELNDEDIETGLDEIHKVDTSDDATYINEATDEEGDLKNQIDQKQF